MLIATAAKALRHVATEDVWVFALGCECLLCKGQNFAAKASVKSRVGTSPKGPRVVKARLEPHLAPTTPLRTNARNEFLIVRSRYTYVLSQVA
eukprot:1551787-Amphidinium_carterae.1